MDATTSASLEDLAYTSADHAAIMLDNSGRNFHEMSAVPLYKARFGPSGLIASRQAARIGGVPIPTSLPADPASWPQLLSELQAWGWAGNTVLTSNGCNGKKDGVYFERELICTCCRARVNKLEQVMDPPPSFLTADADARPLLIFFAVAASV